jgi:hypothetical protein
MSTLVHFNDRCPDQESLISFLYDEFDGSEPLDRRTISRHIETCDRCARQLASLGGVRDRLRAWQVPEISPLAFRVGTGPAGHAGVGAGWTGWMKPAFPLAAAAVLVLGAALGLARLDIQYDKNGGFRVHTGWQPQPDQNASRGLTPAPGSVGLGGVSLDRGVNGTPTVMGTAVASAGLLAPNTEQNRQPWHADMQMLAQTLRQEILASRQGADTTVAGRLVPANAADAALLKRVQQLIDQAEVRQQQNLALRITELSRDFDLQRRSDMAQIEQGLGRLAGQRELDAQQQRLLLNAIRTSQMTPAPR